MRLERQGDIDLIDVLALDDFVHLTQAAEDRHPRDLAFGFPRVVIQKADHVETQLAMPLQLVRDFLAQRPGPEDENALQVLALQADHGQHIPNHVAAEYQKEQVQAGEDGEKSSAVSEGLDGAVRSRIAGGSDPGDEGAEKYSGQQHRDENGQRFVDARPTSANLI